MGYACTLPAGPFGTTWYHKYFDAADLRKGVCCEPVWGVLDHESRRDCRKIPQSMAYPSPQKNSSQSTVLSHHCLWRLTSCKAGGVTW